MEPWRDKRGISVMQSESLQAVAKVSQCLAETCETTDIADDSTL